MISVDTNILVYAANPASQFHEEALSFMQSYRVLWQNEQITRAIQQSQPPDHAYTQNLAQACQRRDEITAFHPV